MQYRVACYFGKGTDQPCAHFKLLSDAQLFIEKKLALDAAMKLSIIYRLYDLTDLIKEYNPAQAQAQGSQGKSSSATFRPTPFNTAPRPAGTPQRWLVDPEDDEKKDKS